MISFQQYLVESRSAPLYHGTAKAEEIIKSNTLKVGYPDPFHSSISPHNKIISLTRNITFAKAWAVNSTLLPVVFVINQQKLHQRYRIKPFSYFGIASKYFSKGKGKYGNDPDKLYQNQYEESVDKDIKNFMSYVDAILIKKDVEDSYSKKILNHPKTKAVKWDVDKFLLGP